jgi:hypothetical protein
MLDNVQHLLPRHFLCEALLGVGEMINAGTPSLSSSSGEMCRKRGFGEGFPCCIFGDACCFGLSEVFLESTFSKARAFGGER